MAIVALSCGALIWFAHRPDTAFLARHAPAHWIVYPTPDWYFGDKNIALDTVFRRTFDLEQVPAEAELVVRAFRRCEVAVNGRTVMSMRAETGSWKEPRRCDVTSRLRTGTNEIVAVVQNDAGPPALWCCLHGEQLDLVSDESWQSSYVGAVPLAAVRPTAESLRPQVAMRRESSWESIRNRWATLLALAATALVGWIALEWWLSRNEGPLNRLKRGTIDAGWWLFILAATIWTALTANNFGMLPLAAGFDSLWHRDYVQYIQDHYALPPADHSAQTHQAPLYYITNAIVLEIMHVPAISDAGRTVMTAVSYLFGLVHFLFIFLSLRLLFPGRVLCQCAGMLFAVCLPVHLFIFQYTTNETLTAAMSSATLYFTLRAISRERLLWSDCLWIGLAMGAAVSSKLTAIVLVPSVLTTLAVLAVRSWPRPGWAWLGYGGLTVAVFVVAGGWHYLRLWEEHGTPLVRQIDQLSSGGYWVRPGYRMAEHFGLPNEALSDPFFAGVNSLTDSVYSTFWGDGRWGGMGSERLRPPWRYDLMAAGYLLALVPLLFILAGIVLATVSLVRRHDLSWFLLLGVAWTMGVALVFENLQHPSFYVAKGWYALPAAMPVCAFLVAGLEPGFRHWRWWRGMVFVLMGTWASCALLAFWIPRNAPDTLTARGGDLVRQGFEAQGLKLLQAALIRSPQHPEALYWSARAYDQVGDHLQAAELYRAVIDRNPLDADARLGLAVHESRQGRITAAESQLVQALDASPDHFDARIALMNLYAYRDEEDKALEQAQQAIRLAPSAAALHTDIAALYLDIDRPSAVLRHALMALRAEPSDEETWQMLAEIDPGQVRAVRARRRGPQGFGSIAHLARVLERLAWRAAIEAEERPELVAVAQGFAQRAVELRPLSPQALGALAAAQAVGGEYELAIQSAQRARRLAQADGRNQAAALIDLQIEAYEQRRTYHPP